MIKKMQKKINLLVVIIIGSLLMQQGLYGAQAANGADNNEREADALHNQANQVNIWKRWRQEVGMQLACGLIYGGMCGSYIPHFHEYMAGDYLDPKMWRKVDSQYYAISVCMAVGNAGGQYTWFISKHMTDEPHIKKKQNKELLINTFLFIGGGLAGVATKHCYKKVYGRPRLNNQEAFGIGSFAGIALYRSFRLAKKLYTKGYSRLQFEDISPPSDIMFALAFSNMYAPEFSGFPCKKRQNNFSLFPIGFAFSQASLLVIRLNDYVFGSN